MNNKQREERKELAKHFMIEIIAKKPLQVLPMTEIHEISAEVARGAVSYADALIKELNKK